jgi:hypothetical protein
VDPSKLQVILTGVQANKTFPARPCFEDPSKLQVILTGVQADKTFPARPCLEDPSMLQVIYGNYFQNVMSLVVCELFIFDEFTYTLTISFNPH